MALLCSVGPLHGTNDLIMDMHDVLMGISDNSMPKSNAPSVSKCTASQEFALVNLFGSARRRAAFRSTSTSVPAPAVNKYHVIMPQCLLKEMFTKQSLP